MNKLISLTVCTLFVASYALGQKDSKKTVILYNVVPLSVDLMKDGSIKTIYGRADNFFKGYEIVQRVTSPQTHNDSFGQHSKEIQVSTNVNYLRFNDQVATLSEATIKELEKIKEELFLNPAKKILITSYQIDESNKTQTTLLQNRMASCLTYLEILGVNKSQIVLDTNTTGNSSPAIIASEIIPQEQVFNK